jgi:hypothetical protein
MKTYPESDDDQAELAKLSAQPWMVECLKLNPSYVHWAPGDDSMPNGGTVDTWAEFAEFTLDDWNEVVHFYFHIDRASKTCEACDGSGLNPATHQISEDFYDSSGTGRRWVDAITQDEANALAEGGRIPKGTTADAVNAANRRSSGGIFASLGHDAINRYILVETRARRLGVYGMCPTCSGDGHVFVEPAAKLGITLWILHPRKGASRGTEIVSIEREEIPTVLRFLSEAAKRNAERFAMVVAQTTAEERRT